MTDIHDNERRIKRIIYREESTKFECPYYNDYINLMKRMDKIIDDLITITNITQLLKDVIDNQSGLNDKYWAHCKFGTPSNAIRYILDLYINWIDDVEIDINKIIENERILLL